MNLFCVLASALLAISSQVADESFAPSGLMLNLMARPELVAVADPKPRFSWIVHSPESDDVQTSYRILVASDVSLLAQDRGDVWDSGQVESPQSTAVEFGGKPLPSRGTFAWKVRTWTKKGAGSTWSKVQTFKTGQVMADPVREHATPRYPLATTNITPARLVEKRPGHYFLDFGRDAFAALKLHHVGDVSARVTIHLGEMAGPDCTVDRHPYNRFIRYHKSELELQPGDHIYTPALTAKDARRMPEEIGPVMPFRYCEIENYPGKLSADAVRQLAVHYPFDDNAARFTSSDPTLNAIWELCKYSIKATSFCGVYVDGDRERLPYEADAYIGQMGHYCCDREFTLDRYSYEYLLEHPTWPTEYQMLSVEQAWADYMYTADPASLRANYDVLKAKTLIGLARADGLISTVSPPPSKQLLQAVHRDWIRDMVDWPEYERDSYVFQPVNTVINARHYHVLVLMSRIAEVLGRAEDARMLREQAAKVFRTFQEKFFDTRQRYHNEQGGLYVDGEGTDHISFHANIYAAAYGLVPSGELPRVLDCLVGRDMACSVFGAQALMEALYQYGEADHALRLLTSRTRRSWSAMLETGSTITLEAWNPLYRDTEDWNHIWGAAPANVIPRLLMGVEPLEPGFATMSIRPQPGHLTHASLDLPTIRGTVHEDFLSSPEQFVLTLELPANTTAKVYLPDPGSDHPTVTLDGLKRPATREGRFLLIDSVGSGKHKLEVARRP